MSFCSDIKNELADIRPSECCKEPLTYGFLLFSRSFSIKRICMQTENRRSAECYAEWLKKVYDADVKITSGGNRRITYKSEVISEADRLKILASVDFGIYDGSINRSCFLRECCAASFIRGAFLACGSLSNPEVSYRADFSVKSEALGRELIRLLDEHFITANMSARGSGYVVYIRRSEMITNLLTVMGASARSLELIETTIIKSVKNNMNRARNCDSGNISRTVEASIAQRTAIEYLKRVERFESLPRELYEAAVLRLENPEASLKELCRKSREPITVSGLNHRLRKIIDIYNECKE